MKRSERKKQVKEEFYAAKEQKKLWKQEIARLSPEERLAAKKQKKLEKKTIKTQRKQSIKAMAKPDKKAAKKHDRMYRRFKHRPRRRIILGVVLLLVAFGVAAIFPMVSDVVQLTKTTDKLTTNSPEAISARKNGQAVSEEIANEGIVLLKNEDNSLPLKDKKLNVFSIAASNIRYGGGGSGGADQSSAVTLYAGLKNAGIEYNEDLYQFYQKQDGSKPKKQSNGLMQIVNMFLGKVKTDEPSVDYLTDDVIKQAKSFSGNALIVLASEGVEAADFEKDALKITPNKLALLDKITQNFDNVIIVINSGNTLELGFLEDYPSLKSALWIGTPGPFGTNSLGKIIAGELNPSGRITDTYAYDTASSPASVNFGNYKYTNLNGLSFVNYNEGIYVGYRYYETYYKDDEAGYKKVVQFPFGYGLSYTSFDWKVETHNFDQDNIEVQVKVTNTGTVSGKDVVQVYFSAPYLPGGIEKSAIELGGYAKTKLLAPQESETVTITFPVRDMASYDMNKEQAYVLDKGTYEIKVGRNVHAIEATMDYTVASTIIYKNDEVTDTPLQNRFDYANGNLTYLSRNDWAGTFPDNTNLNYDASAELVAQIAAKPPKGQGEVSTTNADNGIKLADLKGLNYNDPKWERFLDQFTIDEMKEMVINGGYHTIAVDRLGVPSTVLLDGPAGINFFFGNVTAASYPTEVVLASTWNDELIWRMGEAVGMEANAYGVQGWYAPGMNLHRTPQGGRNFEYFSEDPLLSGKMGAALVDGAQSRDIIVFMKHFLLNEQETNARSGLIEWANEQALRELYLRPFEITVKEGKAMGAMSSFIFLGSKWSGGNPELLQDVLRTEWGFTGIVSTDAVLGGWMDLNLAIRYGNELMLNVSPSGNKKYFQALYQEDPIGITLGLRERVHNITYTILQTDAMK